MLMRACSHTHNKETKNKTLRTCAVKSRPSSLDLLFLREHGPWFPFGKGPLSTRRLFSPPLMSTVRLRFTPGLVLILDRFYARHFWLEYVRNWRAGAESSSEWQEGIKKRLHLPRNLFQLKVKNRSFFMGPIATLKKKYTHTHKKPHAKKKGVFA